MFSEGRFVATVYTPAEITEKRSYKILGQGFIECKCHAALPLIATSPLPWGNGNRFLREIVSVRMTLDGQSQRDEGRLLGSLCQFSYLLLLFLCGIDEKIRHRGLLFVLGKREDWWKEEKKEIKVPGLITY